MTVPESGVAFCAAIVLVSGCAVGPDFERPDPPSVDRYIAETLPAGTASAAVTGGAAQRFLAGRDIPADWWQVFHSAPLNALIDEALKANPTVTAAEAALRQAHELTRAGEGAFFPTAQVGVTAIRCIA